MHEAPAILLQPPDARFVVRKDALHFCPEEGRVVHLLSVTELVDHDVVEDLRGCQQDQAVEIQFRFPDALQLPQRVFWLRMVILP